MRRTLRTARIAPLIAAAAISVGTLAYLLVLTAGGGRLASPEGHLITLHHITWWLIVALAGAVLLAGIGVVAVWRSGDVAELESERERNRQERAAAQRTARAWQRERDWNRALREQLAQMQRSQGVLGRGQEVHTMVLELTMELVDAQKGLLLSDGQGSDRSRQVVAVSGFEHDPTDSAIAQRFAEEVIERDHTVREDDTARVEASARTSADAEVENLLAIPIYLADDFSGVIICANRDGGFAELEDEVLVAVGNQAGAVLANSRLQGDLRSAYLTTVQVLTDAIELKDPDLRGHSDAVSGYVMAVADDLALDPDAREELIFASLLHDVGKLGISERILLKPAGLTPEERSVIELHPRLGFDLIRRVPALARIAPAVLHHHERWDGAGYPGQLRGDEIPLAARIIAVADSFSAIVSDRPYSPAQSIEAACLELERCAGGQFDPQVVTLFVEEVRRRPPAPAGYEPATPPALDLSIHRRPGEVTLGSAALDIIDPVTLLYSHRHLQESAEAEVQRARLSERGFGVVIARLEGIEEVNRSGRHETGDQLLRAVAAVMQRVATELGSHAFRVGGRTLGLLVPAADPPVVAAALDAVERELALALMSGEVAAVVGSATWAREESGAEVIARARSAARSPVASRPL